MIIIIVIVIVIVIAIVIEIVIVIVIVIVIGRVARLGWSIEVLDTVLRSLCSKSRLWNLKLRKS